MLMLSFVSCVHGRKAWQQGYMKRSKKENQSTPFQLTKAKQPTQYQLTAVGYIRVSDEKQLLNHSLETQEQMLYEYAEAKRIRLLCIFREKGVSAKGFANRPAWADLLGYLKGSNTSINYVLVTANDRFSREYLEAATMRSYLKKRYDVAVVSLQNALDPDHITSMLIDAILDILAHFDNSNRSARTRMGMHTASTKGLHLGNAPFGYVRVLDELTGRKPIRIVDEDAKVVKYIFEAYGVAGATVPEIYEAIRDRYPLSKSYLYELLRNPRYCGYIPDTTEEDVLHMGEHDPIISKELFERVQARLAEFGRSVSPDDSVDSEASWLKGLLYCQRCGTKLTFAYSGGNGGLYPYYNCRSKRCPTRLPPATVESFLVDTLRQLQKRTPVPYAKLFEMIYEDYLTSRLSDLDKQRTDLEKRISEQRTALDKATFKFATDVISEERFRSFESNIENRIIKLEQELRLIVQERDIQWQHALIGKYAFSNPQAMYSQLPRTAKARQLLNALGLDQIRIDGKETFTPIFRKKDVSDPNSKWQISDDQL
jgi:site-specific DNA recombinase